MVTGPAADAQDYNQQAYESTLPIFNVRLTSFLPARQSYESTVRIEKVKVSNSSSEGYTVNTGRLNRPA
ncbi:hypothetical protein DQG23_08220 [Paenibacillus contaminans]|uniref:Uncharacterized protein n=1 Tax=Paenibacillus contaminans TaxID=450362 RepID=A0A329MTI2_9BACL|nr:hypothetical protein DQG23_08220 [Paenibacillus contaminans]